MRNKVIHKRRRGFQSRNFVIDGICVIFAFALALLSRGISPFSSGNQWMALCLFLPVWLLFAYVCTQEFAHLASSLRLFFVTLFSVLGGTLLVHLISWFMLGIRETALLMIFAPICLVLLLVEGFARLLWQKRHVYKHTRRILVVGPTLLAQSVCAHIKNAAHSVVLGFVNTQCNVLRLADKNGAVELGTIDQFTDIIQCHVVDDVLFAIPNTELEYYSAPIQFCESVGITVHTMVDVDSHENHTNIVLSDMGNLPVLTYYSAPIWQSDRILKRAMDIIGAVAGILLSVIPGIFIGISIKLFDGGSVFFTQKRVGQNGRVFNVYKFRTMCVDAEQQKAKLMSQNEMSGSMFKIKRDPRVTKVGAFLRKTSLDELPQFWNVLRGDMSLVGTRPPTLQEVATYKPQHRRRLSMKPGITGMWQVSGRNNIKDFEEIVERDCDYIDNWSVGLDVKILLKTVRSVFEMEGM